MKTIVIGSTGMTGLRIVAEAARRGHEVTAEDLAVAIMGELKESAHPGTRFTAAN